MSADPSDITARTLLKGFLAAEAPKSTVKHKPKRRASELERLSLQNQFSTSRNVSSWLSPSIKLREKMKENIVCPVNKVTSKRLLEKHRLGRGVLLSQNDLDKDTPRTILKKIIQTESEVSMLVIEKPQVGRHEQIEEEPAVKNTLLGLDKLEMNMLEPPSQRAATGLSRTRKKKKRVSVSQFERGVEETLPQIKERKERLEEHREHMALANISAMSRSFKMPLSTPSVPESIEKKGLVRRPKKHRFISVEDFEEGINQNLMHLKGSQDCFVESMMTNANGSMFPSSALQMNTEIILSNTELFVKSQPKEQTLKELSQPMSPSILSISKLSLIKSGHIGNRDMASLNDLGPEIRIQLELNAKNKAFQMKGVEEENKRESYPITVAEKELLIEEVEKENDSCSVMDVENEEGLMTEREEKSYSAENTETDMPLTKGVEENIEQMDRMTSAIENGTESSQSSRSFGKSLQGTSKLVNSVFESSEEPIDLNHHAQVIFPLLLKQASGTFISNTAESVVPRSEVRAETEESNISPVNDRWQEEEEFETEQITKNEESGTRASQISVISMKTEPLNTSKHSGHNSTPYSLKTFMNPVSPCTRSTGKDGAGSDQNDDMSYDEEEDEEAECEEPSMDKNAFLGIKDISFSPSLSTPHYLKTATPKFPKKPPFVRRAPTKTDRAPPRMKKEPAFPSRLVKQIFAHYAKMSVAKDSYRVVEKCLDVYFKQLSNDLEVFAAHAKRKKVDAADIELLMRRQGLVTDKMSLHVLIERHLPLEYRSLLIPVAMSGNKVIPKKKTT